MPCGYGRTARRSPVQTFVSLRAVRTAEIVRGMNTDETYTDADGLDVLGRRECVRLLASVRLGRIVHTEQALPAVRLVEFALAGETIVIRTAWRAMPDGGRHPVVAFEADAVDEQARTGWSVTVVGHAWAVEEPGEIAELDRLGLRPWSSENGGHYVRIAIERVTGRRIAARAVERDGEPV